MKDTESKLKKKGAATSDCPFSVSVGSACE
jgi:hypothetical protein